MKQIYCELKRLLPESLTIRLFTIVCLLWSLCPKALAHNYGATRDDHGYHFTQTSDGGYIICGVYEDSIPQLHTELYVIKTDMNGSMQWIKIFAGDSVGNTANSISQTSDGGFIVVATFGSPLGYPTAWLLRLSANGDSLWSRFYHPDAWSNYGSYSFVKADGNYVIGIGGDGLLWENPWHLYETDTSGAILDSVILNQDGWGAPSGIFPTSDGGFVSASTNIITSIDAIQVVKVDSNLQILFDKKFEDINAALYYQANGVCESKEGGYFVAGQTNFYNSQGLFEYYLMKLDANGDSLWSIHFGDTLINNYLLSIRALPDSGFLVTGSSDSAMIFRFDKNGNQIWAYSLGSTASIRINFMDLNLQGGFILVGDTIDAYGHMNAWFASTDTAGNILTSTNFILPQTHSLNIFPNPTTARANITFTLSASERVRADILDAKGVLRQTVCDQVMGTGTHTVNWPGTLASGTYYVRLQVGTNFSTFPLIIQK